MEGISMPWANRKLSTARELARLFKSKLLKLALMGRCPFSAPPTSPCRGTIPAAINIFGTIVGYYGDAKGVVRGFLRTAEGKFSTFQAPGAGHRSGLLEGTSPSS